jgi:hypothetical protein
MTTDSSKVIVYSDNNTLKIYNPENEEIVIYNALGVMLYKSNDNYIETSQKTGLYIVKYNNGSRKVIVK